MTKEFMIIISWPKNDKVHTLKEDPY